MEQNLLITNLIPKNPYHKQNESKLMFPVSIIVEDTNDDTRWNKSSLQINRLN